MNKKQKRLQLYSYDLLAKKRYTVQEMRKKLHQKNQLNQDTCDEHEIEEIIERLAFMNLLNDQEYAESFIDAQLKRAPQGKRKLYQRLKNKGISEDIITKKLTLASIDEYELAEQIVEKKVILLERRFDNSEQIKERIFRFLINRGFSMETVYKVISQKLYK
ncbi:hypothetical protein GF376_01480 [Candidatus Peregrinibacteria bacterium]|nr:hypothetical protein [Candidatus Peregrinibacteria bacterium]